MKKYPIVFSVDEKYLVCAEVAIKSVIENGNKDKFYDINLFHDNISDQKLQYIKNLACKNASITCININCLIDSDILYEKLYFTKAMYYRILIPRLFSNYEKVLYLDCDLIANCDVTELFEEALGTNVIAGVQDLFEEEQRLYVNNLVVDENYYINSGVILFNIKEFLKENIETKFFEVIQKRKDLRCPDQDAINIVCQSKIKLLDMKWNFQWGGMLSNVKKVIFSKKFNAIYEQAFKDLKILHFSTSYKPWIYKKEKLSKYWWKYARHIDANRMKNFQIQTKPKKTLKRFIKHFVRAIFGGNLYMKLKILLKRNKKNIS